MGNRHASAVVLPPELAAQRKRLEEVLVDRGYKEYPPHHSDTALSAFSRRLPEGSPPCDSNDYKISWHVLIHGLDLELLSGTRRKDVDRFSTSVAVEIVAEKHGLWYKLECYSLSLKEAVTRLPEVEEKLLAAWTVVSGGR